MDFTSLFYPVSHGHFSLHQASIFRSCFIPEMNGGMKINMLGFVHVHDINGHDLDISSSDIMITLVINGEKLLLMVIISSYGKYIHLIIVKYGSFPKISSQAWKFQKSWGYPKASTHGDLGILHFKTPPNDLFLCLDS